MGIYLYDCTGIKLIFKLLYFLTGLTKISPAEEPWEPEEVEMPHHFK